MKIQDCCLLLLLSVTISCSSTNGAREIEEIRFLDTPQGRMAELPAGGKIDVRLLDTLSSETAKSGKRFRAETIRPVSAREIIIIPEQSPVMGTVKEVTPPKMGLIKAKIELHFDELMVGGRPVPIDAEVGLDIGDIAKKAGKKGGETVAKEVLKRAFPLTGPFFMAMDVAKGVKYVVSDKEIAIEAGSEMEIKLNKPVLLPYRSQ